jgi:broad specificity phosphatase PhoE
MLAKSYRYLIYRKLRTKRANMEGDNFNFSTGPPNSGFSLFMADRTKKVHFIRHAEGFHNVASHDTGNNDCLSSMDFWDARLTPKGIEQCKRLRKELSQRPSQGRPFTHFDLIVVSPLTRTLETAMHIFGPPRKPGVPKFMCDTFEDTNLPRPKFLVREECRERWGLYTCDGRRPISETAKEFPDFDFSEVEHDEDMYYTPHREPSEHCMARGVSFLEWLNARPEKCIAVVTHSSFLRHLFSQFGGDQSPGDKDDLQRLAGNCELRSIVLCSHGVKDGRVLRSDMVKAATKHQVETL